MLLASYMSFAQHVLILLARSQCVRSGHGLDRDRRRAGNLPAAIDPVLVPNAEPDRKLQEAKPMLPEEMLVFQQSLPAGLEQHTVEAAQIRSVFVPKPGELPALSPVRRIIMP